MEEMERLRAEFLGVVSHELRTPLTSIKGSAATLTEAASDLDPAEMLQFFRIIGEQADYMRDLIGDLLDVARIETGELSVAPAPADVATPGGRGQEQGPERRRQEQPPHRPLAGTAVGHGGRAVHHPGAEQPPHQRGLVRKFITERLEAVRAKLDELRARESMASEMRVIMENLV